MRINSYVKSLDFVNNLDAVDQLIDHAQERITFLGKRVIVVEGYKGSVPIDKVAERLLRRRPPLGIDGKIHDSNRDKCPIIAGKLRKLYKSSDNDLQNRNWFTRCLNSIREFSILPYTTRFHIDDYYE